MAVAVFVVPYGAAMLDVHTDDEDIEGCAQGARELREVIDAVRDWPDMTATWLAAGAQPVIDRADACVEGTFLGPGEYDFPNAAWGCLVLRIESDFPGMYSEEQVADAGAFAEGCDDIASVDDPGADTFEADQQHCQAEEDWIDAEERAYAALDAGDAALADQLILGEVRDAFDVWAATLEPVGLTDEVQPYADHVQTWFDRAADDGIDGYSTASEEIVVGDATDRAFEIHAEWVGLHCG